VKKVKKVKKTKKAKKKFNNYLCLSSNYLLINFKRTTIKITTLT